MTEQKLHAVMSSGDNNPSRTFVAARRSSGHSLIEMLIVVAMIGVLISLAMPQLIAERRLSRTVAVTRDVLTELRHARQLAMSQRQAFTFQYNDATKQISIIDHNSNPGPALLVDPAYPNTPGSIVISTTPLSSGSLINPEISYGIPAGVAIAPLGDGIPMTALLNNQLNITFQPDGSVIDAAGNPIGRAMFIYNNQAPKATASAISIMGASGRVKIWRYNSSTNLYADS